MRLEIPLSSFVDAGLTTSAAIGQMIFSSQDADGNASLDTVYVANTFLSVDASTTTESSTHGSVHNYVVTVEQVDGVNKYFLNAVEGLQIFPEPGDTYVFDLSDVSNTGHVFAFSTTPEAGDGSVTAYAPTSGISFNEDTSTLILVADDNTPSVLYYYCSVEGHVGMGNAELAPLFVEEQFTLDEGYEVDHTEDGGALDYFNKLLAAYLGYDEPAVTSDFTLNSEAATATINVSHLNTDTTDDGLDGIVPDTNLNVSIDLSGVVMVEDAPVTNKVIDSGADPEVNWTGVTVSKYGYTMEMTFETGIDGTIEEITSDNSPLISEIKIYTIANVGGETNEAVLATQTGGLTYFDYIDQFPYLDATTGSVSSDTGLQDGLFSFVDANAEDEVTLGFVNDDILPDFLYEDFDLGGETVVDQVRFYTGDNPDEVGAVVATVIPLPDDTTTVGEVDAYVEQIFG